MIARDLIRARSRWWVAFAVLMGLQVVALYAVQGPDVPAASQADKLVHAAMFALPAVVAVRLARTWPWTVLVLHALLSEPLQAWLTTQRQLDPWDTVADLVGIVLGVLAAQAWRKRAADAKGARRRSPT
ncbi:MAG: VanZ family protein [Ornithinimicrobium sp.]|uniref:VanZ family protein n=1 Tax=Ornithinimicrobium sp. TaxID=1977084 RepID=UPI003D9B0707